MATRISNNRTAVIRLIKARDAAYVAGKKTIFIGLAVIAISLILIVPLGLIDSNAKNGVGSGSASKKIQTATAQNETGSECGTNWLKDFTVPITIAIIGAITASWSFIQAKWNGHYFHNLIMKELRELTPIKEIKPEDGLLKSHMKKSFIHREILYKPTENKESIFTVDKELIYQTRQIWSAFDNNDPKQFLRSLHYLATERRWRLHIIPVHYDRNALLEVVGDWIDTLCGPEVKDKDIEKAITKIKDIFLHPPQNPMIPIGSPSPEPHKFCPRCGSML